MEVGKAKQGGLKRDKSLMMLKKTQMDMIHGHAQVGTVMVGFVVVSMAVLDSGYVTDEPVFAPATVWTFVSREFTHVVEQGESGR